MQDKNYNALSAEMMGWKLYDTELWEPAKPEQYEDALNNDGYHWEGSGLNYAHNWNPLQDRNQAYQLLKRAEELGLAEEVTCEIRATNSQDIDPYAPSDWKEFYWCLTCPTDTITTACVDVWQAWQAEQKAKAAFSRPPVWEEDFPKPATFSEEVKDKFDRHLDSYHLQQTQEEKQQ